MMVFYNLLEIKAKTKKVIGVKVVPFGVLYSCVKFRRLKMGDPVYGALMLLNFCGDWGLELNFLGFQIKENFWEAKI